MSIYAGPEITDSGLVLHLDAANAKGYPGSGTSLTDLSGNGKTGTMTNGPSFSSSVRGNIVFDGTNDYINFSAVQVTSNLTITAWINTTSSKATANQAAIPALPIVGETANSIWYTLGIHGGKVRYINAKKNGVWSSYDSATSVNSGTWRHVAVTHSSSTEQIKIYVDGVLDATFDNSATGSWPNYFSLYMTATKIGTSYGSLDYFAGSLASVKIYNYLHSAAEILQDYSATRGRFITTLETKAGVVIDLDAGNSISYSGTGTTWTDLSGYGNSGTLTNGPTYNSSNGGSIVFDGTNDYVTIPHNNAMNAPDNHTVSVWFYQTAATASWAALFGKGTGDADEQHCLLIDATRTNVYYDIGNGSGPYTQPTTLSFSLNTWYNLVVTQSRVGTTSTLKLYVNGIDKSSSTISATVSPNVNTSAFTIGVARGISFPFPGRIAKLSLYNRTLSNVEISQNFDALRGRFGL